MSKRTSVYRKWVSITLTVMCVLVAMGAGKGKTTMAAAQYYLNSERHALQTFVAYLPFARANVNRLTHKMSEQCMDSALGVATHNREIPEVTQYVTLVAIASIQRSERGAIEGFITTVAGLKWDNVEIVDAIHLMKRTFVAQVSLTVPDLCRGIGSWRKSDFQRLPKNVRRFVYRETEIMNTPVPVPRLLKQYEHLDERGIINQIGRLKRLINRELRVIVSETTRRILEIIGL